MAALAANRDVLRAWRRQVDGGMTMSTSLVLMMVLAHLPVPEEGSPRVPMYLRVVESAESGSDLFGGIGYLRRSFCAGTYHVRLVDEPEKATAVFEVTSYDVTKLADERQRHHITGRYQFNGKWEPFQSWADSGRPGPPPRLGRFVETSLFGEAFTGDEMKHTSDGGRGNPGCAAEQ
jgi:hypothetical protein